MTHTTEPGSFSNSGENAVDAVCGLPQVDVAASRTSIISLSSSTSSRRRRSTSAAPVITEDVSLALALDKRKGVCQQLAAAPPVHTHFDVRVPHCPFVRARRAGTAQHALAPLVPQAGPSPRAGQFLRCYDLVVRRALRCGRLPSRAGPERASVFPSMGTTRLSPVAMCGHANSALVMVRRCAFSRKSRKVARGTLAHVR